MKKFEELDRIQKEFSAISVNPTPPIDSETKDNVLEPSDTPLFEEQTPEASQGLTEEQLQEVFKRTSAFTVRSAMMDSNDMDELNDVEIWQLQYQDGLTDEIYEEEYVQSIVLTIIQPKFLLTSNSTTVTTYIWIWKMTTFGIWSLVKLDTKSVCDELYLHLFVKRLPEAGVVLTERALSPNTRSCKYVYKIGMATFLWSRRKSGQYHPYREDFWEWPLETDALLYAVLLILVYQLM